MERPIVGIAVFIRNENNEILLGHRLSSYGYGTWGLPGGKLDMMESLKDCAKREIKEECNLDIDNLSYIGITNNVMKDIDAHYITIYFSTSTYSGELKVMEEEKCSEWKWFSENDLPSNLFVPLKNYYEKLYK